MNFLGCNVIPKSFFKTTNHSLQLLLNMTKAILPMNISDFVISGKFGENYSKVLINYFNTYFDYTVFNISDNGIITTIEISVKYNSEIIPLVFNFKKDYYQNQMQMSIICMYKNLMDDCEFTYKNFVDFAQLFETTLLQHEILQKFYIN